MAYESSASLAARAGKSLSSLAIGAVALGAMAAGAVVLGAAAISSFRFREGEVDCFASADLSADRLWAPDEQAASQPSEQASELRSGVAGARMIGTV